MSDVGVEQFKANTRQFKKLRNKSLDDQLLATKSVLSDLVLNTKPTLLPPKFATSSIKKNLTEAGKREKNYLDSLATSRLTPSNTLLRGDQADQDEGKAEE
jgi:hypothetical protein